jgi:hypothetical protein
MPYFVNLARAALAGLLVVSTSCSLLVQKTAGKASVRCDNGWLWPAADLVLGGVATAVLISYDAQTNGGANKLAYVPGALFVGSGVLGLFHKHSCSQWRKNAPPEEYARVEAMERAQAEAATAQARANEDAAAADRARAEAELEQTRANPPAPADAPATDDQPAPPVDNSYYGHSAVFWKGREPDKWQCKKHATLDECQRWCTSVFEQASKERRVTAKCECTTDAAGCSEFL